MRTRVKELAHILERIGLALAGAACGLFVGIQVGSSIAPLTTQGFLLLMTVSGAAGAYLGIDTPPHPIRAIGSIDLAELLTAVGTFLAASAAFAAVVLIVFSNEVHMAWSVALLVEWCIGVFMQIAAGAIARIRS